VDELPRAASLVIVGGGFAGASTAFWLARAGVKGVVVIEREAICGAHASGRNAALCRAIADDDETTALTARGAQFLASPPDGFARLLDRSGGILLADDDAGIAALVARAQRHAIAHERISIDQIVAHWPQLAGVRAAGGVSCPGDGVIDIGALLTGYLDGARRGGVRIVTSCELRAITPRGGGVAIETNRGSIEAKAVACAAGAWAGTVGAIAGSDARFTPIKRHLFVTQPPSTPAGAPWVWSLGREPFYARREGSGLLLSGCDAREHAPADVTPDDDARDMLAERIRRAAPGLGGLEVKRAWACLRTFAPDRRMHIAWDPMHPWLFWVAALGGHGATASAAVGERAAAALALRL